MNLRLKSAFTVTLLSSFLLACSSPSSSELEEKLHNMFMESASKQNNPLMLAILSPVMKCLSHEIATSEPKLAKLIINNGVPDDRLETVYPSYEAFLLPVTKNCFSPLMGMGK